MYLTRHATNHAARWAADGKYLPGALTLAYLLSLSRETVTEELWSRETRQKVADSWGEAPTAAHVAEKSLWRDDRLAALAAHMRASRKFGEAD